MREVSRLDRRAIRARFEERFTAVRMAREYEARYRELVTEAEAEARVLVGQMKGQQMRSPRTKLICVALAAVLAASSALAAELSPDAINSAEPSKKSLSKDKATPAGVRL